MKKLGLVLDGGGGRGAYQLGIWKYIKEIGLDKHIKVISGCSVGSLNACLLAMDNYDMAYSIWTNEVKDKIICADVDSIKNQDVKKSMNIIEHHLTNVHNDLLFLKDKFPDFFMTGNPLRFAGTITQGRHPWCGTTRGPSGHTASARLPAGSTSGHIPSSCRGTWQAKWQVAMPRPYGHNKGKPQAPSRP